ncbi:MAG: hypothetical protein ACD_79C00646G0002 [uncultured bacterium]|nr:MAG: hypothetical protein ACD_79C00646G0002 [uncultured bacterium]
MITKLILIVVLFFGITLNGYSKYSDDDSVPLNGSILKFEDAYGASKYTSGIIHYETSDKASIEATVITSDTKTPRPGIIFIHMWARDRQTFWGLPEYLATHGYSSIYMDLRGHGNSKYPPGNNIPGLKAQNSFKDLYLDILPAIEIINNNKSVKKNNLVLIAASLGCPLSMIALDNNQDKFIAMIHLSPSVGYFDVNCQQTVKKIKNINTLVIADMLDESFMSAKFFFYSIPAPYKSFLPIKDVGHGTNILYHNLGFPTIILEWITQSEKLYPIIKKFQN